MDEIFGIVKSRVITGYHRVTLLYITLKTTVCYNGIEPELTSPNNFRLQLVCKNMSD